MIFVFKRNHPQQKFVYFWALPKSPPPPPPVGQEAQPPNLATWSSFSGRQKTMFCAYDRKNVPMMIMLVEMIIMMVILVMLMITMTKITKNIARIVLGKLGPGQFGPGQLGPGHLGPGVHFLGVDSWAPGQLGRYGSW